ncbi:MAG: ACP S-malonyltransferase [Thermoleophilaceae bacterium]|nr:ACP S-malonyltransferase [Thermoleophilaceae bacterium]
MRAGLFPGQGSQTADMPLDTAGQQPAVLAASIESWHSAATTCDFLAGHSLGSYGALVAAGALAPDAARRIVTVRGAAMSEAGKVQAGSMLALLGCTVERASEVAAEFGLTVANDNAPGQVVISGPIAGIERVELAEPTFSTEEGQERRIRLKRLPVSGAFHSSLMAPAAEQLQLAINSEVFGDGSRVIANGTARPYVDPATELAAELLLPVRWRETLEYLWQLGVREFVEFEPAGVLTGLVRRTLPEATAMKISDLVASEAN